jgi:DNA modification methylase
MHPDTQDERPRVLRATGVTTKGFSWSVLTGDVVFALREIDAESVDCVVTSPPYYWQRDYEVPGQIGHESTINDYVAALVRAFSELRRTLKPSGTFFLNLGDTYYSAKGRPHGRDDKHNGRQMMRRLLRAVDGPGLGLPRKSLIGIPWRVALALQTAGWTLRSTIIWQRPASLPEPTAHDRPWRTFEYVFLFSKSPRYWFHRNGLVEEDVWKITSRPENPGSHFAPFPLELVERCLDCGCPTGGVVLDPFVGSGTTMIAALARGSNAIGVDLKPQYSGFTIERIHRSFGAQSNCG